MLNIEDLCFFYREDKKLFNHLNLELASGEKYILSGDNGSGKTTFLKILSTLENEYSGQIKFEANDIKINSNKYRSNVSYFPITDLGGFERLTGRQNIMLLASLDLVTKDEVASKIISWKDNPLFEESLDTPLYLCSTGMKHLLQLFRTTLGQKSIILIDEPFRSLDVLNTSFVLRQLKQLKSLVLITSHKDIDQNYGFQKIKLDHAHMSYM
ncbi:MAG: ATP-binding cassette domain-containing protein [Bdellovibrionaceae bacterium]|jgi:ABC-type multidrug transport system ATPase subunit|nr:ATP-binding cassette domain-containing protein [Pseudobdellovibrionaceae bacterium]